MTKTHIVRSIRSLAFAIVFILTGIPARANTCAAFVVDNIQHNSFRVRWANDDVSGVGYAQASYSTTTSSGVLTGTCPLTGSTSAPCVIGDDGQPTTAVAGGGGVSSLTIVGLPANTAIYYTAQSYGVAAAALCPAVVQGPVTTLANPVHPVYPTPPATFAPTYPTPTGVVYAVSPATCTSLFPSGFTSATYGGSSCANALTLQAAIVDAGGGVASTPQATYGDVIVLQAGSVSQYQGVYPNSLILANGADSQLITEFVGSTGMWTCSSPCGLTVGQQVILGMNFFGGNPNTSLPLPFIPGFPYYVVSTPTSSTFTVSATNGGSTMLGLGCPGGSCIPGFNYPGGCFIATDTNGNVPVPSHSPIQIRSSVPDAQWPPFGVRLDPITFPGYQSSTAQIQIATPGLSTTQAVRFDTGCLAHDYWFGPGIEWNWLAVNTVGAYDGQAYNASITTSTANYRLTFDRNWFHGADYPERDYKAFNDAEGHFIAFLGNAFTGLTFWTPWWNATPILATSSTVITIPAADQPGNASHIWFGNGFSDSLPFSGTITLTGGANAGNAVFEATRSGFFLTLPTGDTATCSITGQTCTVSSAGSPAYAESGGYYSRVPIFTATISAGAWTSVSENPPTSGSTQNQGQEGGVAISITNGPGPYLIQNNLFLNDPGITFYTTGQASTLINGTLLTNTSCTTVSPLNCGFFPAPPGDITFQRNTMTIDTAHLANAANTASNGAFYSMRQHWENKEGIRIRIIGNTFTGAFMTNFSGRGYCLIASSLGGLYIANTDVEVGWNTCDRQGQGFQIFTNESGSRNFQNFDSPRLAQRLWLHDNTVSNVNRFTQATPNSYYGVPGDNAEHFIIESGVSDVILEHNLLLPTFSGPTGSLGTPSASPLCEFLYTPTEGFAFRNNIAWYSNDGNGNGCSASSFNTGTNPALGAQTGAAAVSASVPYNLIWTNNVVAPAWNQTFSVPAVEMSQSQVTTQYSSWSSLVSGAYFPNPSCTASSGWTCIDARAAAIGFQSWPTPSGNGLQKGGNYALRYNSPYISGGASHASDGLDLGPDYLAICIQQGCVQNVRVRSIDGTSAIVSFVAPDSTGCSVDVSTNGLATFTRTSNTGGSRVRDVMLSSLTPSTAYTYRVNCSVQQPVGKFTTTP